MFLELLHEHSGGSVFLELLHKYSGGSVFLEMLHKSTLDPGSTMEKSESALQCLHCLSCVVSRLNDHELARGFGLAICHRVSDFCFESEFVI